MSQSFCSNTVHIVFSTKSRQPMLSEGLQAKVWAYLAGIVKNVRGKPIQIGGTSGHVHLLIALPSDLSVAKMVNVLKSNSSKWLNENGNKFAWQEGYGAFSVSASNVAAVARYIREQEKHHKRRDFKAEFRALLRKHGIQFDEKYLFD